MKSTRSRLDRFISQHARISKREVRQQLLQKNILVNGVVAHSMDQLVDQFSKVILGTQVLQDLLPRYIMLNKPKGCVSATKDDRHTTVIDLLNDINQFGDTDNTDLHIAGRLDFNTTGLLLLSNDGRWSRQLSLPENDIQKKYRVELEHPALPEYADIFLRGIYFPFENLTTRPAQLHLINDHTVELSICEGRYHQVKRMFAHVDNKVRSLHRFAIGGLMLDGALSMGESRDLSEAEVKDIFN